jgi:pimeloyl-ACP methyl ester carboxylesterase
LEVAQTTRVLTDVAEPVRFAASIKRSYRDTLPVSQKIVQTRRKSDAIFPHDLRRQDRYFFARTGRRSLVVLCHGWPELSYSWRHQIPAIAAAGLHVVAPDMRGFGRTSAPADIDACSILDTVVGALDKEQAAVVGHDWGAAVAWHKALFRRDVFTAVAGEEVNAALIGFLRETQ